MNEKHNDIIFDDYVDSYQKEIQSSINFIGQEADFFLRLKAEKLINLVKKYFHDAAELKVLDVGSGVGLLDKYLIDNFKNIYGVDVEQGVVDRARQNNPAVNYKLYNGTSLPFDDGSIDLVFAVNVMHHVPPGNWQIFVLEMHRVLKGGGLAVVFEHNPYNPLTRMVVNRCEFDRDAILLKRKTLNKLFSSADFNIAESSYIIFFPFKGKVFRTLEKPVGWLPLGAQYYVAGAKK